MAVAEAQPTTAEIRSPDLLETRLRELLAAVRKTTLDPPLRVDDLDPAKFAVVKPSAAGPADEYYKTSLETAHKAIIYEIAVSLLPSPPLTPLAGYAGWGHCKLYADRQQITQDPEDPQTIVSFVNLVDCALLCAELEIADAGLPFTLLE